MKPQIDF